MFTALAPTGRAVPSYLHETSPETRTSVDDNGQTENATKLKLSNLYIRIFTLVKFERTAPISASVRRGRYKWKKTKFSYI